MDGSSDMRPPSLTSYLSRVRSVAFRNAAPTSRLNGADQKVTLVMGNPSADLDSFISAVVVSFFFNLRSDTGHAEKRTYVPILNLPAVRANELWRLRPEFGVAVRLALGESHQDIGSGAEQGKTTVLEQLVTIADVKANQESPLHRLFSDASRTSAPKFPSESDSDNEKKQPLFLVDHNSPSIPGLSDETINSRFTVVGCIDHHVDEKYVPADASPRIVTTGIGSCTSLVVQYLRDQGIWPSSPAAATATDSNTDTNTGLGEIAKLALAPILIDTANLQATGDKCSDTDREAVRFLLESTSTGVSQQASTTLTAPQKQWDSNTFFKTISAAKANSLTLLTMQEVLDRDYKAWREPSSSSSSSSSTSSSSNGNGSTSINIGISSLVKPLSWLIKHAGGTDAFLSEINTFASSEERQLGVYCMLTRAGDGRKEVALFVFGQRAQAGQGIIQDFEKRSGEELKLKRWDEDPGLVRALRDWFGGSDTGTQKEKTKGEWKIFWMGDTSKSRKQVAPLLREAVRSV